MKKKKKTKNKKPKKLSDHVNQLTHWTRLLFNTLTQSNSNSIFFPLGLNGEWYCECSLFRSSLIHFKLGLSNDAHTIVKNEITLSPTLSTFISTWHYEPITYFCLYEPIVYLSQSLSEGWPADEKPEDSGYEIGCSEKNYLHGDRYFVSRSKETRVSEEKVSSNNCIFTN